MWRTNGGEIAAFFLARATALLASAFNTLALGSIYGGFTQAGTRD
jgi:hypothetical protein